MASPLRQTYVGDVFEIQLTVDFDFTGGALDQKSIVNVALHDAVRDGRSGVVVQGFHFGHQSVQIGVFGYFFGFINLLSETRAIVVFIGDFDTEHLFTYAKRFIINKYIGTPHTS